MTARKKNQPMTIAAIMKIAYEWARAGEREDLDTHLALEQQLIAAIKTQRVTRKPASSLKKTVPCRARCRKTNEDLVDAK